MSTQGTGIAIMVGVRATMGGETLPTACRREELLQAQAELWCHTFGYLKSIALQCAVELGIPTAIHRNGGSASLPELLATLPLSENKQPYFPRLMRFLASAGIFTEGHISNSGDRSTKTAVYGLRPVSRLLVDDDRIFAGKNDGDEYDGCTGRHTTSLSKYAVIPMSPHFVMASLRLSKWLRSSDVDGDEMIPFVTAHGTDLWGAVCRDAEFGVLFNEAMASDSRFVAEIVVRECAQVFAGVRSLVDVGGGNGATARAIAKAFPHIKCSVLELPHVIHGSGTPTDDGIVEFIAGDMMQHVPSADAVLLKFVLHDWSDEDCVRILTQCREAIPNEGKVIVVDTVIGSRCQHILEAQLSMDLCMMMSTGGKEREEEGWHKIFLEAAFSQYKIMPILGVRSVIEVYP